MAIAATAALLGAALAAGFVNALAGGGTLLSYPALTAYGLAPIAANVTSTLALAPGYLGARAPGCGGCCRRRCSAAWPAAGCCSTATPACFAGWCPG
jgi:hypothetical protein